MRHKVGRDVGPISLHRRDDPRQGTQHGDPDRRHPEAGMVLPEVQNDPGLSADDVGSDREDDPVHQDTSRGAEGCDGSRLGEDRPEDGRAARAEGTV